MIDSEVGNIINMSSVVISQLLGDAQDKGIALDLETATVENQVMSFNLFIGDITLNLILPGCFRSDRKNDA